MSDMWQDGTLQIFLIGILPLFVRLAVGFYEDTKYMITRRKERQRTEQEVSEILATFVTPRKETPNG